MRMCRHICLSANTHKNGGPARLRHVRRGEVKTGTDPSALRSAWVSPRFYGNAINEEDGTGALTASSVYAPGADVGERLAYTYGALSNGVAAYAYHDQLGSTRAWRWFTKALAGRNEFAPYGEKISGYDSLPRDYALHVQDPYTLCYHAPYREYAAGWARWTTRDPLGMVDGPNMYAYVGGRAIRRADSLGLRLYGGGPYGKLPDLNVPDDNHGTGILCALNAFRHNYMDMREANTIGGDKYFHCKANCEAKQCGGAGGPIAVIIDILRELTDLPFDGWDASVSDMGANGTGLSSNGCSDCKSTCGGLRPNGLSDVY